MSIDLFSCLQGFVAVAESNGFSGAARKLRISTSVLSKQIQKLEKQLGKKLFERTTRYISLTEAGNLYFKNAKKILMDLKEAEEEVNGLEKEPHGKITIGMPGVFNSIFHIKSLESFMEKYPKIILQTTDINTPNSILNGSADLVISEESFNESQLIKEKFLTIHRGLFASPKYLKKHGTPKKLSDLKNHNCILYKRVLPEDLWIFPNNKKVSVSGNFISDSGVTCILAAIAGIGIIWCSHLAMVDEIKSGKIVEIKLDTKPLVSDAYLYYRPTSKGSNTQLIIDHLKAAISHVGKI